MIKYIVLAFILMYSLNLIADEGFFPSNNPNVFLFKGSTVGATMFLVNFPMFGKVLMTQVHVIENVTGNTKLYSGYSWGPFYVPHAIDEKSFSIAYIPEILWQDKDLDVAILKAPEELIKEHNCDGFKVASYEDGKAFTIGYPITARRGHGNSRIVQKFFEMFGQVEQMLSSGDIKLNGLYADSDIDVLPGSSGGPLLNTNGDLIGIIHQMKTWYGLGYEYINPNSTFTPMDMIIEAFKHYSNLIGTWKTACVEEIPRHSSINNLTFQNNQFTLVSEWFETDNCEGPIFIFIHKCNFSLGYDLGEYQEFNEKTILSTITPLNDKITKLYKDNEYCGLEDWVTNLPLQVNGHVCGNEKHEIPSINEITYTIINFNSSELLTGVASENHDGKSPEQRMIQLEQTKIYKKK